MKDEELENMLNMLKKYYADFDKATKSNVVKWHKTVKDQLNKVKNMPKNYQDNERFKKLRQTLLDEKALSIYIDPTTSIKEIIDSGREAGHLEIRKEEKNPSYEQNVNMNNPNETIVNLLIKIKNPEIPYDIMWKSIREAVQNYEENKQEVVGDQDGATDASEDPSPPSAPDVPPAAPTPSPSPEVPPAAPTPSPSAPTPPPSDQMTASDDLQTFLDDFKRKTLWWNRFCLNFQAERSIDRDKPRVKKIVTEAEKVVEEKERLVSYELNPDSLVNAMTAYFTAQKNLKEVKDLQLSLDLDLPDGWELQEDDPIGYYYVNKGLHQKQLTHPSDGFIATQQKANKYLQKIFWFSFLEYDRIISKNDKAVDNKPKKKKKKIFWGI